MTLRTRKVPSKDLYWVIRNGRKVSSKPTTLGEAVKIMEKIRASPRRSLSGGDINAVGAGFIGAGVGIVASILFNRWGQTGLDWGKRAYNQSTYAQDAYSYLKSLRNNYISPRTDKISSNKTVSELKAEQSALDNNVAKAETAVDTAVQNLRVVEGQVLNQPINSTMQDVKGNIESLKKRTAEVFEEIDSLLQVIGRNQLLGLILTSEIKLSDDAGAYYVDNPAVFPTILQLTSEVESYIGSFLANKRSTEARRSLVVLRKVKLMTSDNSNHIDVIIPVTKYDSFIINKCSGLPEQSAFESISSAIKTGSVTSAADAIRNQVLKTTKTQSSAQADAQAAAQASTQAARKICYTDSSGNEVNVFGRQERTFDGNQVLYDFIVPSSEILDKYFEMVNKILVEEGLGKTGKDDILLRVIVKLINNVQ